MGARENIGWERYGRQEKKRQERAGSGISTRAGTGEKIKKEKGKRLLFFTTYDPHKN